MWRKYFGEEAIIYGIDINPYCAQFDGLDGQVRIGSQGDEDFLKSVITEMGGVDIILDDGSHNMDLIKKSILTLFPYLNGSGLYMIEDLHTAYWPAYGGGVDEQNNFFNFIRDVTDEIHLWYHDKPIEFPQVSETCRSIHTYDSIVVFEKGQLFEPTFSSVGDLS
jgi:hypothetical protein